MSAVPDRIAVQRANTEAFIAMDPVTIILKHTERVSDGAGGYINKPGVARREQTFRLIPASDRAPEVKSSSGRVTRPEFTIMGRWDADMDQWDTFERNGRSYEIVSPVRPLHSDLPHDRKADVVVNTR